MPSRSATNDNRPLLGPTKIVAGAGLQDHRQASCSHAGIDHRDKNRALRPKLFGLIEPVGAFEDARILVTQIRYEQALGYAIRHTLHGGHRTVLRAKVAQQHQGCPAACKRRDEHQAAEQQHMRGRPTHAWAHAAEIHCLCCSRGYVRAGSALGGEPGAGGGTAGTSACGAGEVRTLVPVACANCARNRCAVSGGAGA